MEARYRTHSSVPSSSSLPSCSFSKMLMGAAEAPTVNRALDKARIAGRKATTGW